MSVVFLISCKCTPLNQQTPDKQEEGIGFWMPQDIFKAEKAVSGLQRKPITKENLLLKSAFFLDFFLTFPLGRCNTISKKWSKLFLSVMKLVFLFVRVASVNQVCMFLSVHAWTAISHILQGGFPMTSLRVGLKEKVFLNDVIVMQTVQEGGVFPLMCKTQYYSQYLSSCFS